MVGEVILEKRAITPDCAEGREKRPHQHLFISECWSQDCGIAARGRKAVRRSHWRARSDCDVVEARVRKSANNDSRTNLKWKHSQVGQRSPVLRNHVGRADGGTEPFRPIILHRRSG